MGHPLFTDKDVETLSSKPVLPDEDQQLFANPREELQQVVVGRSFRETYEEAARFLNFVVETALQGSTTARVLDFGCGWGRMLRMIRIKPELKGIHLHGCDVEPKYLEVVRRSVPHVSLQQSYRTPPAPYVDDWFDVIYAYSVFSHLSPESNMEWATQFARILKPGGRVVLTTQGHTFMHVCRQWHVRHIKPTSVWEEKVGEAFHDPALIDRYNSGEFLFHATHPNVPTYGDSIVPRQWFEKNWGDLGFTITAWDDTPVQNYCTLTYNPR